jgi:hypothetical protein
VSELPAVDLESQATEERRRLQASLEDLKQRVHATFDLERYLSRHGLWFSGIAALSAATLGYGLAGLFSRRREPRSLRS